MGKPISITSGIDLMEWLLCISGEVKASRYFQHDRYGGKLNGSYWLDNIAHFIVKPANEFFNQMANSEDSDEMHNATVKIIYTYPLKYILILSTCMGNIIADFM